MKVGFIGLGRMGSAMARRLLEAGHDLVVYNRTPAKAQPLADGGARVAATVAAAVADREAVVTMLTDDAALDQVAGGLLAALPAGAVHVAMGTHGVTAIGALAAAHLAAGQDFVAAPVLGRPDRAASGQLGIVAAGAEAAVDRLVPLFDLLGSSLFRAGPRPESATAIKIANNFVLASAIEVLAESMALVRRYEVAPELFQRVLTEGLFDCLAYRVYGDIIVAESYDQVGVTARIGRKDAGLALTAGGAVGVPLPSAELLAERFDAAIDHGDGDRDWAVLGREQARRSGLE